MKQLAIAIIIALALYAIFFVGRLIYLIIRRIRLKKQEDFENRDH